jgi:hypothetical protein
MIMVHLGSGVSSMFRSMGMNCRCRQSVHRDIHIATLVIPVPCVAIHDQGHDCGQVNVMQAYTVDRQGLQDSLPFSAVSLDCHHSSPDLFLVAHDSGLVALHHSLSPHALRVWACREGICAVKWLPESDSRFVVIHVDGAIAVADSLSDDAVVSRWAQVSMAGQVSSVCTSSHWSQESDWLVLASTSGEVQLHRIPTSAKANQRLQDLERQLLQAHWEPSWCALESQG